jgi:hypothetical protein
LAAGRARFRELATRAFAAGLGGSGVAGTINKLPALRSAAPFVFSAAIR